MNKKLIKTESNEEKLQKESHDFRLIKDDYERLKNIEN